MAIALRGEIGGVGSTLILLMMVNAALLGATAISLSSAWAWGEVMAYATPCRPGSARPRRSMPPTPCVSLSRPGSC